MCCVPSDIENHSSLQVFSMPSIYVAVNVLLAPTMEILVTICRTTFLPAFFFFFISGDVVQKTLPYKKMDNT